MLLTKPKPVNETMSVSSDTQAASEGPSKARSIRQGLIRSLLLVLGILLFSSAWLIDQVIDKELYARFDGELLAVARSLETLTLQEKHGVELHFSDAVMPNFRAKTRPDYFELKTADGVLIERSNSLAVDTESGMHSHQTKVIELKARLGNSAVAFVDVVLPDGRLGRLVRLRFQPGLGDSLDRLPAMQRPQPQQVELLVARDMDVLTGVEKRLHASLVALVVALLAITGLLVWWRVGRELNAIDRLAEQARRIGQSQHEPVMSLTDVPQELMPLILRINESSESIAKAMERERRWSRDLAHELRTPIAELRTLLDVAISFPEAHDAQKVQAQARAISMDMDSLVSSLLLMSRVESGTEGITLQAMDLHAELAALSRKHPAWHLAVPAPCWIQSDPRLLKIVLSNIVNNALAYAEPLNSVRITIIETGVAGQIALEISNGAPALKSEDLAQMTKRFWRQSVNADEGARSGLGLSIASALCDMLNLKLLLELSEAKVLTVRIEALHTSRRTGDTADKLASPTR
jgi:signal transduction histidine kinase